MLYRNKFKGTCKENTDSIWIHSSSFTPRFYLCYQCVQRNGADCLRNAAYWSHPHPLANRLDARPMSELDLILIWSPLGARAVWFVSSLLRVTSFNKRTPESFVVVLYNTFVNAIYTIEIVFASNDAILSYKHY